MPNGVCAPMEWMQCPASQPPLDRSLPNSQPLELPPTNDPMLPIGKPSDQAINPHDRARSIHPPRSSTRSALGTHAVLNALLVGHVPEADGPVRTHGGRIVSKPSRKQQKRPQPAVAASGFDPFK